MVKVLFAHGFEGTPNGSKPTYMADEFGWEVISPKMSELGWTIEQETEVLLRVLDEDGPFDLIAGSSMGGLAAANASALRPDENFALLLIAPAFGLADLWRKGAGEDGLAEWKEHGEAPYFHHGFEENIMLGWDFMESAELMSWPELAHPTVILHGTEDDVVPIENSRKVAAGSELVELVEIEDGHRMLKSLDHLASAVEKLGLS